MKKVIAVFLALLMFAGVMQVASVPVYAEESNPLDEAPVPEGWTLPGDAAVSGYKPFSYPCDYCGETHEGLFGMLIAMLHMVLSMFNLGKKAVER